MHQRRLGWADLYNARDLGGQPTPQGPTRYGAVVRTESLTRLTAEGRQAMLAHGIGTIVDLRSAPELARDGHPLLVQPSHVHRPLLDEAAFREIGELQDPLDLYVYMIDRRGAQLAEALRAVVGADGGAIVHCHAGKDRTGVVVALLLDSAGVDREAIVVDYALSGQWLQPLYEIWARDAGPEQTLPADQAKHFASRPETMQGLLSHLDRRYGGTAGYLFSIGLEPAELEALAALLRPTRP